MWDDADAKQTFKKKDPSIILERVEDHCSSASFAGFAECQISDPSTTAVYQGYILTTLAARGGLALSRLDAP